MRSPWPQQHQFLPLVTVKFLAIASMLKISHWITRQFRLWSGGDAQENARITKAIFAGERGAPRDAVLLNAAAAIAAFDGEFELSLHERLSKSLKKATESIDAGKANYLLDEWILLSNKLAAN